MNIISHIAHRKEWENSASGESYKPSYFDTIGFIHCSTIGQTVDSANQYFANQLGLVLLLIDETKLESDVKYEPPASVQDSRVNDLFPHIYGPINLSAVVQVVDFVPNKNGKFEFPDVDFKN